MTFSDAFYKNEKTIPSIVIADELKDEYKDYMVIPNAKVFLSFKENLKEVPFPIDSRFINYYNVETQKFTLPMLSNENLYLKQYIIFIKNSRMSESFKINEKNNPWLAPLNKDFDFNQLYIQLVD